MSRFAIFSLTNDLDISLQATLFAQYDTVGVDFRLNNDGMGLDCFGFFKASQ